MGLGWGWFAAGMGIFAAATFRQQHGVAGTWQVLAHRALHQRYLGVIGPVSCWAGSSLHPWHSVMSMPQKTGVGGQGHSRVLRNSLPSTHGGTPSHSH